MFLFVITFLLILIHGEASEESFFWRAGEHYVEKYSQLSDPCWKTLFTNFQNTCRVDVDDLPGVGLSIIYVIYTSYISAKNGIGYSRLLHEGNERKSC